jgi:tetratricopeptide (TPR) repeat protein
LADAYNNRGLAYSHKGELDKAIADFNKAIALDPRDGWAYKTRALLWFDRKAYDKAWGDVKKAQELGASIDPQFLDALCRATSRKDEPRPAENGTEASIHPLGPRGDVALMTLHQDFAQLFSCVTRIRRAARTWGKPDLTLVDKLTGSCEGISQRRGRLVGPSCLGP